MIPKNISGTNDDTVFTARRYAIVAPRYYRRRYVSVDPSLCPSNAGNVSKWLNGGSRKQRHMWPGARDSSFLLPKILAKPEPGQPNVGAKCRWGEKNSL